MSGLALAYPPPFEGTTCTRRDHVVSKDDGAAILTIDPSDDRMYRCDCGCVMIGNGRCEIRFGLLPHRFPADTETAT